MVTAKDRTKFLNAAFQAGAMDYISKLADTGELLARVRSALALKQELDFRKHWEEDLTKTIETMGHGLRNVDALRAVLPLCAGCMKIQTDRNTWRPIRAMGRSSFRESIHFRSLPGLLSNEAMMKHSRSIELVGLPRARYALHSHRRMCSLRWPHGDETFR